MLGIVALVSLSLNVGLPATRLAQRSLGVCASSSTRISPAAARFSEKLSLLPSTRTAPVDINGLGRLVRASDGALHGSLLLQILLALKADGKWRHALALAAMVEASPMSQEGQSSPRPARVEEEYDEDDDDDDREFRRRIKDSPNFMAAPDKEQYDELARLMGERGNSLHNDDKPPRAQIPAVDTVHYNLLISMCADARRWRAALSLLVRMRERRVPRDTVTYNAILKALHRGGRSKLAVKLFKQMRSEGIQPNTVTFASAIAASAAEGSKPALELLELACQSGTPRNTILYSACVTACEKAGEWEAALELLERMDADGVAADTMLLNAAVAACARGGNAEAAESIVRDRFGSAGEECVPDRITYNSLISAHARNQPARQPEKARSVLQRMRELSATDPDAGIGPDVRSYNALMNAYSRAGDAAAALSILHDELPQAGLKGDAVSYTTALGACNATGDWATALQVLREAEDIGGMALGTLAYSKVIGALASGGQWHDACKVLSRISECDLPFNPRVVNLALGACADVEAGDACEAGRAGLHVLRTVLSSSSTGASEQHPTRGPAVDGETIELTKRLLDAAGESEQESTLVHDVEEAASRKRPNRRKKSNKKVKTLS